MRGPQKLASWAWPASTQLLVVSGDYGEHTWAWKQGAASLQVCPATCLAVLLCQPLTESLSVQGISLCGPLDGMLPVRTGN